MYSLETKNYAIDLRKRGFSIKEIARKLNISQSTSSYWLRDIKLDKNAISRLKKRRIYGQYKSGKIRKLKKDKLRNDYHAQAKKELNESKIDKNIQNIICSVLFWAEGSKNQSCMIFTNSDPKMIFTFITLLRNSFDLDESKFRVIVHIHDYHNEEEIKEFWSKTTNIPLSQFNKSYRKPNTRVRRRPGYKGCAVIKYYDYRIALSLNSLYNTFAGEFIGV